MIGLLQRVQQAQVDINNERVASIGPGLMILVGVQRTDNEAAAERLLDRLLGYRVFPDAQGKMNMNVTQVGGELLLVPQFTLAADTRSGTRPGFSSTADPQTGKHLFDHLLASARRRPVVVESGRFGADMQVSLVNDGPVTFWLEVTPRG